MKVLQKLKRIIEKKALVIGAGFVGVSTAYHLSKKGYQVLILHAGHGPATGASTVAAGGMARSNSFVTKASWITTIKS